jgi:hypothetical protein
MPVSKSLRQPLSLSLVATSLALLWLTAFADSLLAVSGEIKLKIKLNALIIPSLEFQETPLEDALEFLRQKSDDLDKEGFGINMVVASDVDLSAPISSLTLKNTPFAAVLGYVCEMTGNQYRVDRNAVIVYRPKAKVPADSDSDGPRRPAPPSRPDPASFQVRAKLEHIVLPSVDFYQAPLTEVVEYLRIKSTELDDTERNPAKKGINFVISGVLPDPRPTVTLKLKEVPLSDVLRYIAGLTDMTYDVAPHAVTLRP